MDLGLRGKIAIVAGGARGCGFAVARELALEGARVAISGRDSVQVQNAAASLMAEGLQALGVAAEMSTAAGALAIVEAVQTGFGAPDILVVNPRPVSQARGFDAVSAEDFRDAHESWVMSIVHLARLVLPGMVAKNWGRIVYLGSVGMKHLHLEDPMYAQNTRVAAAGLMKTLAHEYGKNNITANCIATGPFLTGLAKDYMGEEGALSAEHMLANTAAGRWGRPEEMGAVVAFLCSTRASYLSGETIRVDANYTHNLF